MTPLKIKNYTSKPVQIEAVRWFPDDEDYQSILAWSGHDAGVCVWRSESNPANLVCKTNHGEAIVLPGDWVIKNLQTSECYPCNDKTFREKYQSTYLETVTISAHAENDDPIASLCEGHVDAATYNAAHKAEGWDAEDETIEPGEENSELKHEWWTREDAEVEGGTCDMWSKSEKGSPGAIPVTVRYW